MLSKERKEQMLMQIIGLLAAIAYDREPDELVANTTVDAPAPNRVEMLTLKECTEVIQGLSEHTIRQLVLQGKVKSVRTGQGRRGKILVNKADLVDYCRNKMS